MAQLQQLAQLKESGVLTEEEFQTQKRRLLLGVVVSLTHGPLDEVVPSAG